jgi:hypothetical protein
MVRNEILPVRPRESLVMMVPVTAKPTRKGQLRFHSRLKNTGHGSNFGISQFSLFAFFCRSLSLCVGSG